MVVKVLDQVQKSYKSFLIYRPLSLFPEYQTNIEERTKTLQQNNEFGSNPCGSGEKVKETLF